MLLSFLLSSTDAASASVYKYELSACQNRQSESASPAEGYALQFGQQTGVRCLPPARLFCFIFSTGCPGRQEPPRRPLFGHCPTRTQRRRKSSSHDLGEGTASAGRHRRLRATRSASMPLALRARASMPLALRARAPAASLRTSCVRIRRRPVEQRLIWQARGSAARGRWVGEGA